MYAYNSPQSPQITSTQSRAHAPRVYTFTFFRAPWQLNLNRAQFLNNEVFPNSCQLLPKAFFTIFDAAILGKVQALPESQVEIRAEI